MRNMIYFDRRHRGDWSHLSIMARSREHSEGLRRNTVDAHMSERGYKAISKAFQMNNSTVQWRSNEQRSKSKELHQKQAT